MVGQSGIERFGLLRSFIVNLITRMRVAERTESTDVDLHSIHGPIRWIRYPSDGAARSRKVISRSKTRGSGKYPSWKMGRMLHWESTHELNAFRLLDANPAVLRFSEQPLTLRYVLDGVEHDHYPDIQVVTEQGKELWEVKTGEDAVSPEVTGRTRLLTEALPAFGFTYRVVVAEDLAVQPRLTNLLFVLRHGRMDIPLVERERIRALLAKLPNLTWGAVRRGALGNKGMNYACRLILEGALLADMSGDLPDDLPVRAASPGTRTLLTNAGMRV